MVNWINCDGWDEEELDGQDVQCWILGRGFGVLFVKRACWR